VDSKFDYEHQPKKKAGAAEILTRSQH